MTPTAPPVAGEGLLVCLESLAEQLDNDFEIICQPGSPSDGVRAAMILHNGAPVELIEFRKGR